MYVQVLVHVPLLTFASWLLNDGTFNPPEYFKSLPFNGLGYGHSKHGGHVDFGVNCLYA